MELQIIPLPDNSVIVYEDNVQVKHGPNNIRTANMLWSRYGDAFVPYLPLFDLGGSPVYSVWTHNQDGILRSFRLVTGDSRPLFGPGYVVVEGACTVPTDDQIAVVVAALKEERAYRELLRPYNLLGGTVTDVMDEGLTVEAPNGRTYTVYISEMEMNES
jgi:hypothetical protein